MIYYNIDCILGNGKNKPYPSDHVLIYSENITELIKKFATANKSLCFECWEKIYIITWIDSFGEKEPSDPIEIHFLKSYKIDIPGFGIFDLREYIK